MSWFEWLLGKFYGTPKLYWDDYSINYIIQCEIIHFTISAFVGFLVVYLLIGTTYFQKRLECHAPSTYRFLFWLGVFFATVTHLIVDYTGVA